LTYVVQIEPPLEEGESCRKRKKHPPRLPDRDKPPRLPNLPRPLQNHSSRKGPRPDRPNPRDHKGPRPGHRAPLSKASPSDRKGQLRNNAPNKLHQNPLNRRGPHPDRKEHHKALPNKASPKPHQNRHSRSKQQFQSRKPHRSRDNNPSSKRPLNRHNRNKQQRPNLRLRQPPQAAPKPAQPQQAAAPKPQAPPAPQPAPEGAQEAGAAAPEAPDEETRSRLKGVFSTQSVQKVGTGTTARKTIQKMYWYTEEQDDGTLEIQALNTNQVPAGPKSTVTKDELLEKYSPEPEYYQQTVFPKMRELVKTISRAERHRKRGEYFSAEFEFQNALNVDEENVRANFGLGLTYLERGETSKANNIFERLVKLDAAFEKEHKHLFNEFGIKLRKNKMYDQSVDYYERAMSLSEADENLHYNIARAYFDKREIDKTKDHLLKALQMNSEHEAAKHFLEWMKEKKLLEPNAEAKKEGVAEAAPAPKPEEGK
jgi:tetratricopeptide (TPR) repeat protein